MWLIILICLLFLAFFYLFLVAPRLGGREKLIAFLGVKWAHRGLHNIKEGIPENSMAAFRAAAAGRYGIELDVHLTRDGQIVVFHDDTFERVCSQKGTVEETDYQTMKEYTLLGTEEHIPLLRDVLRFVDGRVPLLIEVKLPTTDTRICEKLIEALNGYEGKYLIQSFNCFVLRWLKKYRKDVLRGQLSENLTRSGHKPHYVFRFSVKYLLTNAFCRPDFISYRMSDTANISLWLNQYLFRAPIAVWTLRGDCAMQRAKRHYQMYIFEKTGKWTNKKENQKIC